jgi:hypothetical protein
MESSRFMDGALSSMIVLMWTLIIDLLPFFGGGKPENGLFERYQEWHRHCWDLVNHFWVVSSQCPAGEKLKSDSNTIELPKSCGKCGQTIKMRDSANTVLCTAILEVVEVGFEDVCEHYVESDENPERLLWRSWSGGIP